jgi:hypothetical protein
VTASDSAQDCQIAEDLSGQVELPAMATTAAATDATAKQRVSPHHHLAPAVTERDPSRFLAPFDDERPESLASEFGGAAV